MRQSPNRSISTARTRDELWGFRMNKSLYSTSEVARVFQISRVTVFRWVQEGNIKAYKVGKHLKIPSSEIERLRSKFGLPEDLLFRRL
jgi:excisionase family DNA binding protein